MKIPPANLWHGDGAHIDRHLLQVSIQRQLKSLTVTVASAGQSVLLTSLGIRAICEKLESYYDMKTVSHLNDSAS